MTRILKYVPVIGQQYNNWTVISDEIFKKETNRGTYWKVQCKCGRENLRLAQHLVELKGSMCKSCSRTNRFEDAFALTYLNQIINRANKIGVEYNLTPRYMYDLFIQQNQKCSLSGIDIKFTNSWKSRSDQTASLDRIDNTKGYIIGNVQWVHKQINFMKGTMTQEDFINFCKLVASR